MSKLKKTRSSPFYLSNRVFEFASKIHIVKLIAYESDEKKMAFHCTKSIRIFTVGE